MEYFPLIALLLFLAQGPKSWAQNHCPPGGPVSGEISKSNQKLNASERPVPRKLQDYVSGNIIDMDLDDSSRTFSIGEFNTVVDRNPPLNPELFKEYVRITPPGGRVILEGVAPHQVHSLLLQVPGLIVEAWYINAKEKWLVLRRPKSDLEYLLP